MLLVIFTNRIICLLYTSFVSYNEDYYNTLYDIFNGSKNGKATLFLGKVDIDRTIKKIKENLKTTKIVAAKLNNDAGVLGAATLGMQNQ